MYIVAVANGKGGVGKTTTCANGAVNFAKRGYYTVMIDTDPLCCLQDWWELRQSDDPTLISVPLEKLAETLPKLREAGVEFLFIDTPGFASNKVNELLDVADLVLIMSKASPLDLRATMRSLTFIEDVKTPVVFVLNEVKPKTRIANESLIALSRRGKLAPMIHSRNDFVVSMIDGRTLEEIAEPDSKGIQEVDELGDYILQELGVKDIKRVDRTPEPKAEVISLDAKRKQKA